MNKDLKSTIDSINKKHGKGSIIQLDSKPEVVDIIPTGSIGLNTALGIGGWPRSRIVEVYGPNSCGKTTLMLHAISECQKLKGTALIVDAEHAIDRSYAENLGVDIKKLLVSQPGSAEEALSIMEEAISSGKFDLVILDSVASLVPKVELEGDMGSANVGLIPRLMGQSIRKLTGIISNTNTCVIFLNQIRMKIGISWGNPETQPGGLALKFAASIRVDMRKSTPIKQGEEVIGNLTNIKIIKNKMAPPATKCSFDIYYGRGISESRQLVETFIDKGILTKKGSFYSYGDTKLGQGLNNVIELLDDNEELMNELMKKL